MNFMSNPYSDQLNKYKSVDIQTRIEAATPHELIELLLQGARNHISSATGYMNNKNMKDKGEHLGKAMDIIENLKTSIDQQKGGDVAVSLMQFYTSIQGLLLNANLNNDEDLLIRANDLLAEILEAWRAIKPK